MKTLIKWPGGKKNEIKYIKSLIPKYENYVEPFLGGGALYFDLEPKKAYINDISSDLIQFYKILSKKENRTELRKILLSYNSYWNLLNKITDYCYEKILGIYTNFKKEILTKSELKTEINKFVSENKYIFIEKFPKDIYLNKDIFIKEINKNLYSKIIRTSKLDKEKKFSEEELKKNMETAIKSSFYMHERYKMNSMKKKEITLSKEENTANFYFVREYCYGSMFRFNKNGDFNIPYGGMSYNDKNFLDKINNLFSESTYNLLKTAHICNMDFEDFLNKYKFTEKDFIFFDPPYDTEFSSYDTNRFSLDDQKRLAEYIYNIKAKFIFIIKRTDFIWELYNNKNGIYIESFEKTYNYNMRGRNERDVEHLIIHNIKNPQTSIEQFE